MYGRLFLILSLNFGWYVEKLPKSLMTQDLVKSRVFLFLKEPQSTPISKLMGVHTDSKKKKIY